LYLIQFIQKMSLLVDLSTESFVKYVERHFDALPPFVDPKTKSNWCQIISLFRDRKFIDHFESISSESESLNLKLTTLREILSKYADKELDAIKTQYNTMYLTYILKYKNENVKPLRYLIYRHGFESEFNDLITDQKHDVSLLDFKPCCYSMIYPGNPYLYCAPVGKITDVRFLYQHKLEGFLDCDIYISDFQKSAYKNPSFGDYNSQKITKEREILYIILKAYNKESLYLDKDEDDQEDETDDEKYNSQDDI